MSKRTEKNGEYLSDETVSMLNDKHGWFQYEDAQSDVSRAFANNAVHAFIEIAKEAECAKQETGMSPSELVAHLQDTQSRIAELEKDAARYRLRLEAIRALYPSAPSDIELDTAIDTAMQKD